MKTYSLNELRHRANEIRNHEIGTGNLNENFQKPRTLKNIAISKKNYDQTIIERFFEGLKSRVVVF